LPDFRVRRKVRPVTNVPVFGLTGGIGSGKSTVAQIFEARGVTVVSADQLAREAVVRGSPGLAEIENQFGRAVLLPDGSLNRSALGELVFRDAFARAKLNGILHPLIQSLAQGRFAAARKNGATLICYDAPLLFETGAVARYRPIVVVNATEERRAERVFERDGLSLAEFRKRDRSQIPLAEKVQRADFVIDNSLGRAELEKQVDALIPQIAAFQRP
jgi:dephospho-CoA kinase